MRLELVSCVALACAVAACDSGDSGEVGQSATGSGGVAGASSGGSETGGASAQGAQGGTSSGGSTSGGGGAGGNPQSADASAGGAAGSGGGTSGNGGTQTVDAQAADIVSDPPPGVQIVPGPGLSMPDGPHVLDYSGYPDGPLPDARSAQACADCADDEFCFEYRSSTAPGSGSTCGAPTGTLPPTVSCYARPTACTDECPGICGCDGKLYCSACIANAWGQDRIHQNRCEGGQ